jgi:GNAT superfamily N-acetyltransferase
MARRLPPAPVRLVTAKGAVEVAEVLALFAHAAWTKQRTRAQVQRMLRGTDVLVLARRRGRPMGFARMITDGVFRAFVEDVIVAPEGRGQGIGTRMLRRLERAARRMGVARLELVTREPGFWRRLGYARKAGSQYMVKRLNGW